jgi:hypothetical protein
MASLPISSSTCMAPAHGPAAGYVLGERADHQLTSDIVDEVAGQPEADGR